MKTHQLIQGSPEWLAHRGNCWNAGDAAAMLGCSSNETRTELLDRLATGLHKEFSDYVQEHVIEPGHEFEERARAIAEEIVGEDLGRLVGSLEVGLTKPLGASFDGITFVRETTWEHKRLNAELRAAFAAIASGEPVHTALPKAYRVQVEQQQMVSGAARSLFMASDWNDDGTLNEEHHCWYETDLVLRDEIMGGWKLLEEELPNHVPGQRTEKPVAKAVTALPSVIVQISGNLAVRDNFAKFELALRDFIDNRLIREPATDQDFADLDLQIKALEKAEEALNAAEAQMLAQVSSVDQIKRTKDMLHKLARDNRLMAQKLLASRKEQIKAEIVAEGVAALRKHIEALNARIGKPYMPVIPADFAVAVKNRRTVDSLREAMKNELTRAKIAASEIADRIQLNLNHLREHAKAHTFLFADTAAIVLKAPDDLQALVTNRIGEHQRAEEKRLDEQREKIRQEEEERARKQAAEKNAMALQEIQGIQQQVMIATLGRSGVRKGGTIECIRETLAETEGWRIEESNFGALTGTAQAAKDKAVADIRALLADAEAKAAIATAATPAPAAPAPAATPAAQPMPVTTRMAGGSIRPAVFTASEELGAVAIDARQQSDEKPTMNLGALNARLGGPTVTAEFLESLGFPAHVERSSKLYRPSLFPAICEALIQHLTTVADEVPA